MMNECLDLSLFYKSLTSNRKFSDKLGRYYTPINIAEVLSNEIGKVENSLVIDLGSGCGNLIIGSLLTWKNCKYHAYDIDNTALQKLESKDIKNIKIYTLDIIIENLPNIKYDFAISNPPYFNLDKKKILKYLDKETAFEQKIFELKNIPAPLIFLSKALKSIKNGGKVGIILPNGILKNKIYYPVRKILNESYTIKSVITLQPYTFEKTETYASILVIEKTIPKKENKIVFYNLENNKINKVGEKNITSNEYALEWREEKIDQNLLRLNSFIENIFRGKYSSKYVKTNPEKKIFHTTNFDECKLDYVPLEFNFTNGNAKYHARKGDILIGRVGRNSFRKIKIVRNKYTQISDCIIVVRPINGKTKLIYNILKSSFAQNHLELRSRGTGAKYITYEHILSIPTKFSNGDIDGI